MGRFRTTAPNDAREESREKGVGGGVGGLGGPRLPTARGVAIEGDHLFALWLGFDRLRESFIHLSIHPHAFIRQRLGPYPRRGRNGERSYSGSATNGSP